MSRQKNSILKNEHGLNREPVPLSVSQNRHEVSCRRCCTARISLHLHEENWLQFSNSKHFFSRIHNHLRGFLLPSSSSLFALNFKPPFKCCLETKTIGTCFSGESLERGRRHVGGKKKIKIEQVALSARLTREDKVMLSCLNSMTSLILELKAREVLRD